MKLMLFFISNSRTGYRFICNVESPYPLPESSEGKFAIGYKIDGNPTTVAIIYLPDVDKHIQCIGDEYYEEAYTPFNQGKRIIDNCSEFLTIALLNSAGSKLRAVKALKYILAIGLKDAKDIADLVVDKNYTIHDAYNTVIR